MAFAMAGALAIGTGVCAQETLNNQMVLKLLEAGLPAEAVIAKIKASPGQFDLSTDQLIALKNRVPGNVLGAMLEQGASSAQLSQDSPNPNVPHYPGIYMFGAQDNRMFRLQATASNQAKSGGIFGFVASNGIATLSMKATIPGQHARIKSGSTQPVFYMFFDESVPAAAAPSPWGTGAAATTVSPNELSLVRLNVKKRAREARYSSLNIAGKKTGVMDKDRIDFEVDQVRPGVFKVIPSEGLAPGEYAFIQAVAGGSVSDSQGARNGRLYDFAVVQ